MGFKKVWGLKKLTFSGKKGLSLLELITVLAILLVLSVFALPAMEVTFVRSREKLLHERLTLIRKAIDNYTEVRNGSFGPVFPPSLASLTEKIPDSMLRPGENAGPFLTEESLGNPFTDKGDQVYWEVRDMDGNPPVLVTEADFQIRAFDVSYPAAGVNGWSKASDDTFYKDW